MADVRLGAVAIHATVEVDSLGANVAGKKKKRKQEETKKNERRTQDENMKIAELLTSHSGNTK